MENGVIRSNNSTGICVSEKDSTLLLLQNGHVGLGLNLQSTQTFPPSMKGRGHHHYYHDHPDDDDHHRPLPSSGALNGSVGPTPNSGPTEPVGCGSTADPTHIYTDGDDVPIPIATCSSGGAAVTALQSFDISIPATSTAFKSPGGGDMAAAALGFPFTSAQWKELERQAMIYKYMMASVPVPPDLLLPIIQSASAIVPTASHSSLGNSSLFNLSLRFSPNNKDPEPGRCKRTDGKKWRCSRDAAPQQKYCERHMHRGRPRSRKPVEVQQPPFNSTMSKKSRLHHHPLPPTPTTTLPNSKAQTTISSPHLLRSTFPLNETPSSDGNISGSSYKENGGSLDWAMEGEMLAMDGSEKQWQHFLQADIGSTTNASVFQPESRNSIAYTDFGALEADQQNDDCTLFLNPDLVCIEKQAQVETPRGFIDAWSNDPKTNVNIENKNDSSICSHCNLSFSDLTLSMAMAAGNAIDEGMSQIPVGLGIRDSNDFKPQVWLGPSPWLGSNPGGPLAEVLRPTSCTAVSSDPTSPRGCCNGDSTSSTPATRASSPSGVLQRAMLSLSDSSGCNSPTIAASMATPEMKPFQWLS